MEKRRCIVGLAAVALIIVLLVVPGMAGDRSDDSGEVRFTQEGSATMVVFPDRTTGTAAPVGRGGSCGPDTQPLTRSGLFQGV